VNSTEDRNQNPLIETNYAFLVSHMIMRKNLNARWFGFMILATMVLAPAAIRPTFSNSQFVLSQPSLGNPLQKAVPRFDSTSSQSKQAITEIALSNNNSEPLGITMDSQGNIWFAENNPSTIVMYNPSAQVFTSFRVPTEGQSMVWFMLFDNNGDLWFSNALQPYIWSFSPRTHVFANFSTNAAYVYPYSLAYDNATQEIWFTSIYTDQIGYFTIQGTQASLGGLINMTGPSLASGSGPRYGPSGLEIDPQGNIFVSNTFAVDIAEYGPTQQKFVHYWNLPPGSQPVGIALDNSMGRIWFANHATSLFGYVDEKSGRVTEFATSLFNYLDDNITLPYWIQLSPSGSVWFDEHESNKIARFDPSTGQLTEFQVPSYQSAPLHFVIDNQRGLVWFTEFFGGKLGVVDQNQSCGCSVELSPSAFALSSGGASIYLKYTNGFGSGLVNSSNPSSLISGSLSVDGYLAENLSISSVVVNSSFYRITIKPGNVLGLGNYTLTFCPEESNSYNSSVSPPIRECAIAMISIAGSPGPNLLLWIPIGAAVVIAALVLSLFFVRRWRHP
jgi:streptogramin lyase